MKSKEKTSTLISQLRSIMKMAYRFLFMSTSGVKPRYTNVCSVALCQHQVQSEISTSFTNQIGLCSS